MGEVESVQFLSPDVALMHALGGTVMRGKSRPAPERDSIQTLVAVKRAGEWHLAAFQNTRVRPMGGTLGLSSYGCSRTGCGRCLVRRSRSPHGSLSTPIAAAHVIGRSWTSAFRRFEVPHWLGHVG